MTNQQRASYTDLQKANYYTERAIRLYGKYEEYEQQSNRPGQIRSLCLSVAVRLLEEANRSNCEAQYFYSECRNSN